MRWPADYHMHTPLCRHAVGAPDAYAAQAVRVGLTEIGFSDHSPMSRDDFDDWRMKSSELDGYVESVREVARSYPKLNVKLGLEVDFIPGQEAWVASLATRHPWDYFIGSVHYVSDSWDVDNPNKIERWRERNVYDVWKTYFDRLTQAAASGFFQIIGHADLAKKFGFLPQEDCQPLYERFLEAAAQSGVAIELNTAGLRKACHEIYPARVILVLARERGVPITFGSDSHAPGEVGQDFAAAVELARSVGYSEYCRFTQGRSVMTSL